MNYKFLRQLSTLHRFILGSASPRRKMLLEELRLDFDIVAPEIAETVDENFSPHEVAESLARQKANDVASRCQSGQVVMGCDTIVHLGGRIICKPDNESDAISMLTELSGQTHTVCSAISLIIVGGAMITSSEETKVRFNDVSLEQIANYVATGEPMDKAGAYGIQGKGAFLVDSIEGNLDTVIGLPRLLLEEMAQELLSKP